MLAPERTLDDSLLIAFYRNNRLVGDNLAAAGVGNGETVAVGSRLRGSGSTGVPCGEGCIAVLGNNYPASALIVLFLCVMIGLDPVCN